MSIPRTSNKFIALQGVTLTAGADNGILENVVLP